MKRLIKKSDNVLVKTLKFLEELPQYDYLGLSDSKVQFVVDNNQDCTFNGIAYRVIFIDKDKINGEINIDTVKEHIMVDSKYCSFSKSLSGIDAFAEKRESDGGKSLKELKYTNHVKVVVQSNISSGLDLEKISAKYIPYFNDEENDFYDMGEFEMMSEMYTTFQEILAKFDNFEIVEID